MKFALVKEHRDFFARHRYIEFDGILSDKEDSELNQAITSLLIKKIQPKPFSDASPRDLYLAGRDLWREDPAIAKISLKKSLAEIAGELFKESELRIAFDQFQEETFSLSIEQMSSISPILGAVAIPLGGQAGRAIYFSASAPLNLHFFSRQLLIIAYSANKSQYTLNEKDPNTHNLKKIGYAFGDLLKNDTHPLLLRAH